MWTRGDGGWSWVKRKIVVIGEGEIVVVPVMREGETVVVLVEEVEIVEVLVVGKGQL